MIRRRGFTLIELLVVIAIIAILAAILFPVFTFVRERGFQTRCLSNMNQLGKAMMRYCDDNGGAFPQCCDSGQWTYGTWRERIQPYVKNREILNCSSKTKQLAITDPKYAYWHYGICAGLTHPGLATSGFIRATGSWGYGFTWYQKLQQPSQTFMVAENKEGDWSTEPMTDYPDHWYSGGGPGSFYPYHLRRTGSINDYDGGGNFIFCDGHAKFLMVNEAEGWDPVNKVRTFKYWIADKAYKLSPKPSGPNG